MVAVGAVDSWLVVSDVVVVALGILLVEVVDDCLVVQMLLGLLLFGVVVILVWLLAFLAFVVVVVAVGCAPGSLVVDRGSIHTVDYNLHTMMCMCKLVVDCNHSTQCFVAVDSQIGRTQGAGGQVAGGQGAGGQGAGGQGVAVVCCAVVVGGQIVAVQRLVGCC